jgi:anti-anti-sigma factor
MTVRPVGHLDLATAPDLRAVLHKVLAEAPTAIIVDMAGVRVDDDSCLTLFPAIARQAEQAPATRLLLCGATGPVASSYRALGLQHHVPLHPTWDEAYRVALSEPPGPRVSRRLAPTPDAPSQARRFASGACDQWQVPWQATERVLVIITELVGNVVLHARSPMEIVLRRSPRHVHVAVLDEDERPAALRGPVDALAADGRGLLLVDTFAAAWGCTPTVNGKSTWATVRHVPPFDETG